MPAKKPNSMAEDFRDDAFSAQNAGMDTIMQVNGRNMDMMSRCGQACAEHVQKVNGELGDFIANRLEKDREAGQRVASCRTMDQLFHAQREFMEQAVSDYAEEASKLFRMSADTFITAVRPIEEAAEETLKQMNEMKDEAEREAKSVKARTSAAAAE